MERGSVSKGAASCNQAAESSTIFYIDQLWREMRKLAQVQHPRLSVLCLMKQHSMRFQGPQVVVTELLNLHKVYKGLMTNCQF